MKFLTIFNLGLAVVTTRYKRWSVVKTSGAVIVSLKVFHPADKIIHKNFLTQNFFSQRKNFLTQRKNFFNPKHFLTQNILNPKNFLTQKTF